MSFVLVGKLCVCMGVVFFMFSSVSYFGDLEFSLLCYFVFRLLIFGEMFLGVVGVILVVVMCFVFLEMLFVGSFSVR